MAKKLEREYCFIIGLSEESESTLKDIFDICKKTGKFDNNGLEFWESRFKTDDCRIYATVTKQEKDFLVGFCNGVYWTLKG